MQDFQVKLKSITAAGKALQEGASWLPHANDDKNAFFFPKLQI